MEHLEFECEEILAKDLLKALDIANSGGVAKHLIKDIGIKVNGEILYMPNKKLKKDDRVEFDEEFQIDLI